MTILQMSSGNGCYIAWNTLGSKIAGLESLSERPPTVSLFSISTDSWKYPYVLRKSMTRPTGLRCPVKYQIKCWLHIPAALQFARNGSLSQDCAYMKREETEMLFCFFFSQSWLNKGTLFLFLFLFIYLFTKKKKKKSGKCLERSFQLQICFHYLCSLDILPVKALTTFFLMNQHDAIYVLWENYNSFRDFGPREQTTQVGLITPLLVF